MYLKTAAVLALFMGLTIVAWKVNFGDILTGGHNHKIAYYINNLVAVGIAAFKAFVVVMYFMHLKWASSTAKVWALMGFFFLPVLFSVFCDYGTRTHEQVDGWIPGQHETALPRVIGSADQEHLDPQFANDQNRNPKSSLY
ncbi:MAG: cytochrome C oxidase subunit IV family protein, partial [Armatimonadota bacterium]